MSKRSSEAPTSVQGCIPGRLTVETCVITVNGTEYNCTVPSGVIKLIKPFVIQANQTIILTMDFDAQKSITEKGSHKYMFQPVIKIIQE